MNFLGIPDSSKTQNPGQGALTKYALNFLCEAFARLRVYNLKDAGRIKETLLISFASISFVISTRPISMPIEIGTIGIMTDFQLEAVSNLAPQEDSCTATLRSSSRVLFFCGLIAKPERAGLMVSMCVDEMENHFTIVSRTPAGDKLRHS